MGKKGEHWPMPPIIIKGPFPDVLPDTLHNEPEVKKMAQSYSAVKRNEVDKLLSKHSSWNRMKRGDAW